MLLDSRNAVDAPVSTDIFVELENDFGQDATCNLNHELIGNLPCTVTIMATGTSCATPQLNLCFNATFFVTVYMMMGHPCPWCERPAAVCWKVVAA